MNNSQKLKCAAIAEYYGQKKQEMHAIQKLSELTCLLARNQEQRANNEFVSDLRHEIADCLIIFEQLQQIYLIPDSVISYTVDYKIARQLKRIESDRSLNKEDIK